MKARVMIVIHLFLRHENEMGRRIVAPSFVNIVRYLFHFVRSILLFANLCENLIEKLIEILRRGRPRVPVPWCSKRWILGEANQFSHLIIRICLWGFHPNEDMRQTKINYHRLDPVSHNSVLAVTEMVSAILRRGVPPKDIVHSHVPMHKSVFPLRNRDRQKDLRYIPEMTQQRFINFKIPGNERDLSDSLPGLKWKEFVARLAPLPPLDLRL